MEAGALILNTFMSKTVKVSTFDLVPEIYSMDVEPTLQRKPFLLTYTATTVHLVTERF